MKQAGYRLDQLRPVMQQNKRGMTAGDIWKAPDGMLLSIVSVDARRQTAEVQQLGIEQKAIDKSARDYAAFAGKPADRIKRFPAKLLQGAGWELGTMHGVLYEADIYPDGKTLFFHRFKKGARPTIAVMHNGRTLATLGGAFQVTERGIVDD